jgi:hypothetical protein
MMHKTYAELIAQADQAVSGVKDAELRRVAFERVLDDLLSGGRSNEESDRPYRVVSPARRPTPKARARGAVGTPASAKRLGPQGYVEELIEDGFFKKQKTISEVKAELGNRGHHIALTSLSGPLQKLCQKKALRRQKIDGNGGKKTFGYSNW